MVAGPTDAGGVCVTVDTGSIDLSQGQWRLPGDGSAGLGCSVPRWHHEVAHLWGGGEVAPRPPHGQRARENKLAFQGHERCRASTRRALLSLLTTRVQQVLRPFDVLTSLFAGETSIPKRA